MEVKEITAEQTYPLRHRVLWQHLEKESDCTIDIDHRPDAIHLGAFHNGELVSIGSFFNTSHPDLDIQKPIRLRAMATAPRVRGMGAGKALIEAALQILPAKGYTTLWCDARKIALGFYEKCGFDVQGDFYDKPKIGPHRLMFIEL